jgi:hypothetical protein
MIFRSLSFSAGPSLAHELWLYDLIFNAEGKPIRPGAFKESGAKTFYSRNLPLHNAEPESLV